MHVLSNLVFVGFCIWVFSCVCVCVYVSFFHRWSTFLLCVGHMWASKRIHAAIAGVVWEWDRVLLFCLVLVPLHCVTDCCVCCSICYICACSRWYIFSSRLELNVVIGQCFWWLTKWESPKSTTNTDSIAHKIGAFVFVLAVLLFLFRFTKYLKRFNVVVLVWFFFKCTKFILIEILREKKNYI